MDQVFSELQKVGGKSRKDQETKQPSMIKGAHVNKNLKVYKYHINDCLHFEYSLNSTKMEDMLLLNSSPWF